LCWKIIPTILTKTQLNKMSIVIQQPKSIIINMSALTKKTFSRNAHENTKLMNHQSHCLLYNESLSMAWTLSTHTVYKLLFVYPSLNEIPFLCNHLRNFTQSFIWCPACLQNLQTTYRTCSLGGRALIFTCTNLS
jgi:hypothetical protein